VNFARFDASWSGAWRAAGRVPHEPQHVRTDLLRWIFGFWVHENTAEV
jgi:hypothetical protein